MCHRLKAWYYPKSSGVSMTPYHTICQDTAESTKTPVETNSFHVGAKAESGCQRDWTTWSRKILSLAENHLERTPPYAENY